MNTIKAWLSRVFSRPGTAPRDAGTVRAVEAPERLSRERSDRRAPAGSEGTWGEWVLTLPAAQSPWEEVGRLPDTLIHIAQVLRVIAEPPNARSVPLPGDITEERGEPPFDEWFDGGAVRSDTNTGTHWYFADGTRASTMPRPRVVHIGIQLPDGRHIGLTSEWSDFDERTQPQPTGHPVGVPARLPVVDARVECPACGGDMVDTGKRETSDITHQAMRIMYCPRCCNESGVSASSGRPPRETAD